MAMTQKQEKIMFCWDDIESGDLDISTERLMAMVQDMTPCSHDEMMNALHASGTLKEVKK